MLLYAVREFLYAGMRKNRQGEFAKLNEWISGQTSFDALVIGSSRAESHFHPRIFDSITGLKTFNAGMSGAMLPVALTQLKVFLTSHPAPKYLLLNIDLHAFNVNDDTLHNFPKFFPYLNNDTLYQALKMHDQRFVFFKHFPFYSLPFLNDYYLSSAFRGYFNKPTNYDKSYYNGFVPEQIDFTSNVDVFNYRFTNYQPSAKIMEALHQIIEVCKLKNIQLFMVVSPLYYKMSAVISNKTPLASQFNSIAKAQNAVWLDFTNDEMCYQNQYFVNPKHLNERGALIFSQKMAQKLKQYIDSVSVIQEKIH